MSSTPELRRRGEPPARPAPAQAGPRRFVIEPVEPRLLYSADFAAAFTGGAVGVGGLFDERRLDAPALQATPLQAAPRAEIALVDGLLPAADGRLAELQARRQAGQPLEIVTLDAADDGIARATELLRGRADVGTLHLLGRTVDGTLHLGRTALDEPTLLARAGELAAWGQALAPGAQLLLPGSDVAAGSPGATLRAGLAALTGADVAVAAPRALIVVAANLPDSTQLVAELRASSPGHVEVLVLAADRDGLAQIGERLAQAGRPFDAVHLVSHASPGRVDLGTSVGDRWLDEATFQARHEELARWSTGFTADGDLLLYGCDLAGSAAGERLLAGLGAMLGVDVAASTDATGAAAQGGDWALEARLGEVAPGAPLAATAWTFTLATVTANVFADVVDGNTSSISALIANPGPDGGISLREAVLAANTTGASDIVTLRAGTYTLANPLTVSQSLEIVGAGTAQTFIAGGTTRLLASPTNALELRQLTLTNQNAAPSGTNATLTILEDTPHTLTAANFGFTDMDGHALASVRVATLPSAGSLTLNGTAVVANQEVSAASIAANQLVFRPALNANGNSYASFTFQVRDNGGTANGGVDLDQTPNTLTFNVTPVNEAPSGTSATLTILEDSPRALAAADFGFSDVLDGNTFNGVRVASLPGAGSLRLNGTPVVVNQDVSAADIAANRLVFTPAANANGNGHASFDFQVRDNGGTANGGIDLDPTPNTLTFDVMPVNDAPSGTSATLTILEDTPRTLTAVDFGFSDPVEGHAFNGVRVVSLPGAGSLRLNGSPVTLNQTVSAADLAANLLVFTPVLNANGNGHASFNFQVRDDGGTLNGGVDLAPSRTLTFNVTAVNDAPTIVAPAGVVGGHQGQPTQFASILNRIEVADIDAGGSVLSVSISASGGALFDVGSVGGLTFTVGDGASDSTATFSGTIASLNAALQSLSLQPAPGFTGLVSVTVEVNDLGNSGLGGALTAVSNLQVNFAANSKPVLQLSGSIPNYVENAAALALDPALVLSDADDANLTRAVVEIIGGRHPSDRLTVTTTPGISWIFDAAAGLLTLTGSASLADYQATLRTVAYSSTSNHPTEFSATRSMRWFVVDSVSASLIQNSSLTITAVNDAPTGTNAALAPLEDTTLTLSAANFGFTDIDGNTLTGVVIASLPLAGSLTLNGVAVGVGQEVSQADINAGLLRFAPVPNANGNGYASFTFQVRDNGGTANGGVDLDPTANTVTFNVTAVNDAPTGTNATLTILEDTPRTLFAADFGFSDPVEDHAFNGVRVVSLPVAGSLRLNGTAVAANQDISAADIAGGRLVFTPALNANGNGYASFSFRVRDNGGTGSGGVDRDPTAKTLTFDVTPVNDAPTGTSAPLTLLEDTTRTLSAADFGYTDTEGDAFTGVVISSLPLAGSLSLDGTVVTPGQFVVVGDISKLVFTPAANANGSGYASFTFQVRDNGGTTNGGVELDPTPNTLTFNVTQVNDAPTGTSATLTILEDTPRTLFAVDFGFSDLLDGNAFNGVRVVSPPGAGSLQLNGTAVAANQDISAADIAAGRLVFTPALNASGDGYASFNFQVRDNGGTANGGIDLDPTPNTLTFNVTPVNDAPAGTNAALTPLEDTTLTLSAANFGYTDIEGDAFTGVVIASLPLAGSLALNGVAVGVGQEVSQADINTGLLRFVPVLNANGNGYASFTFQVRDNGGTANGGIDLDPTPDTLTFNVTAVNDAPTGTSATLTILEDTQRTLTAADFGFSDPLDSNAFNGVRVASLPGAGSLRLNGTAVAANQDISAADIAAGQLVFTPALNGNGSGYASFSFQVRDDGGTANGGVEFDPTPNTLTFDVTPVNDAPAGASATLTILEDTPRPLTAADFGFSDPLDGNAFNGVRVVSLPGAGSLRLNGTPVVINQDVSAADLAANLLVFTPALNANGNAYASFSFRARDDGGTLNGGVDLATTSRTLTFNVTNVNDAPVASGTSTLAAIDEDASAPTGASVRSLFLPNYDNSADGPSASTLEAVAIVGNAATPGQGRWQYSANAGSSWSDVPTSGLSDTSALVLPANNNTYRLRFLPAADYNGTPGTLTVRLADGSAVGTLAFSPSADLSLRIGGTGDWSAGTVPLSTSITADNDRPVASGNATLAAVPEDTLSPPAVSVASLFAANFSDSRDGALATALAGVAITGNAATAAQGAWQYSSDGTTWAAVPTSGLSDSAALVLPATHFVRFMPLANYNGTPGALTVRLADSSQGSLVLNTSRNISADLGATGIWSSAIVSLGTSITAVNDAPTVTAIASQTIDEDLNTGALNFTIGDQETAASSLVVTATSSNTTLVPNANVVLGGSGANRTVTVTPVANASGTATITVNVSDGTATTPMTFDVTVKPVNDSPTLALPIANQAATEDSVFAFTLPANTFADVDLGDTLAYSATRADGSALPAWLAFDAVTRSFSGTPANDDVGLVEIRVTAADAAGAQASGSFTLTVANTNDAPTLALPIANQAATEDSVFAFTLPANTFADVDLGDSLAFTATRADGSALPAWLRFDPATLVLQGAPRQPDAGPLDIRVTATDRAGQSASIGFRIDVTALPFVPPTPATPPVPAPVFAAPPPAPAPAPAPAPTPPAVTVVAPPAATMPQPAPAPAADPLSASLTPAGGSASQSPSTPAPSAVPVSTPSNTPVSAAGGAPAAATGASNADSPAAAAGAGAQAQEPSQDGSATAGADGTRAVLATPSDAGAMAGNAPAPVGGQAAAAGQVPAGAETPGAMPGAAAVANLGRWVAGSGFGGSLMAPAPVQPNLSWAPIGQLGLERGAFDSALGVGSSSSGDGTASQRVDNSFRQLREDTQEEAVVEQGVVASSVVISTGFSFGYVLWLARGGALLASLASAIPAWAMVDPLPVLSKQRRDPGRDPDDQDLGAGADNEGMPRPQDDEVEDMFGAGNRAAAKPRTPPLPAPPQAAAAPQPAAEAQS